jgi:hypothetical protein
MLCGCTSFREEHGQYYLYLYFFSHNNQYVFDKLIDCMEMNTRPFETSSNKLKIHITYLTQAENDVHRVLPTLICILDQQHQLYLAPMKDCLSVKLVRN